MRKVVEAPVPSAVIAGNHTCSPRDVRVLLLAGWSCLAFGDATTGGSFSWGALLLVALGTCLLVGAASTPPVAARSGILSTASAIVLLLAVAGATLHQSVYGGGTALGTARFLLDLAALVAGGVAVAQLVQGPRLTLTRARVAHTVVVVVVAGSAVMAVHASPRSGNDVWYMLQATSEGLLHGRDMYLQHWPAPPGEDASLYTYLPGTPLLLLPFRVLFGDVRYGYVAALSLTSFLVSRLERSIRAVVAGCLLLLAPLTVAAVEQAWNEPLILGLVVATVYFVERGRLNWAAVAFGLALVTKQYAWVIVPFAAYWRPFGWRRTLGSVVGAISFMVPWMIANWHAFVEGSVVSLLRTSGASGAQGAAAHYLRYFTLSLGAVTVRHGYELPVAAPLLLMALVFVVTVRRLGPGTFGFVVGSAATLAVFDLFSPHSFYNQWWLVTCLVTVALACAYKPRKAPIVIVGKGRKGADLVRSSVLSPLGS